MMEREITVPSEGEKAPPKSTEEGEIEGGEEELHGHSKEGRDTNEEMNKDEWTIPSRGRQVRISSFFVYNIPDSMAEKDLRMIFNEVETLIDVYIARKRDKYKKRFGFLKIKSNIDFPELLQLLQNKEGNGAILTVSPAKFDRQGKPLKEYERYGRQHDSPTENHQHQKTSTDNLYSFRPTISSFPRIHPNHSQPFRSFKDILLHEPSNTVSRFGSQPQINLPPNPYREYHAWSKTTILITANTIKSMQQFYFSFLSTKPAAAKSIRYVGGLSLLITFSSSKGAEDYYHDHKDIFSRSLKSFALYEDFMQDFGRIIKIKIFGVPLRFWDGEIFDAIAKNFGDLMEPSSASINDSNLRYSTALIKIKSSERVNCKATIRWKNIAFDVRVDEEVGEWLPFLDGEESHQIDDQPEARPDNGIAAEASTVKDVFPAKVSSSASPNSPSKSSLSAKGDSSASARSPAAAIDDVMEIVAQSLLSQISTELGTQQATSGGESSLLIFSKEALNPINAPVESISIGVNEIPISTSFGTVDFEINDIGSTDSLISSINSNNDPSKTQESQVISGTQKAVEDFNIGSINSHMDELHSQTNELQSQRGSDSQAHEIICSSKPALETEYSNLQFSKGAASYTMVNDPRELSNSGNRENSEVEISEPNQQVAADSKNDVDPAVVTNDISTLVQQNNLVFREIFQVSKKNATKISSSYETKKDQAECSTLTITV